MKRVPLLVFAIVAIAVAAWVWQRRESSTGSPSTRPSVVLVTIDTLRADRVGRGLTPNLDALAARGTTYQNVRTALPLTLPAHVSLMTGAPPYAHGVRENGVVFDRKLPTLARRFRDAGYRTAAFVGAYVLNRRFGLDEGFGTYDDNVRRDARLAEQLEAERPAAQVVDAALAWLAKENGRFFLWVHVYDPHIPYAPPPEFLTRAKANPYDGEVAYADAQIGRLLDAVEARGSDVVIAVAGDHGEGLGEHGEQTHGMLAYDSTLKVPLILAGPTIAAGTLDQTPRSLIDLAPQLLAVSGLEAGKAPADVYAESRYPRRVGWHPLSVLADEQWKLIASSEMELYDIRKDPAESANVAGQHPNVVQAMHTRVTTLAAVAAPDGKVAPEATERLRALGYVSGSNAIRSDDPKAPNPARHIAAWSEFEKALGELQDGRAAAALTTLRSLASRYAEAPVFQTTYARALRETGRTREAVAAYRAAVSKWPTDATLFHDLAVAAREAGDEAEALRAEQAALALDGSSAMALNGLGLLHADAGRHADAVAAFENAAKQDPTNASYWTNLGNARRGLDDGKGAEAAYRKALEVDGGFADALNGLGAVLVQSRRSAEAIPMFEHALLRDPQLHEARLNLGIAYQQTGQREKAAAAYRDVLAKAPSSLTRERQAATELLRQLR